MAEQGAQDRYRIFGSEMSPYSVKMRSYCRYKAIPHQWIHRGPNEYEEYKKYSRLPIVPTVVTPQNEGLQDSTLIMQRLDNDFPKPSIHPDDPALAFLSLLIEEHGDEWGNKIMFHYRWWSEPDRAACSHILARGLVPYGDVGTVNQEAAKVHERMIQRGRFVGSSAQTAPLIAQYFIDLMDILEPHFERHRFLFGARPSFGDFGLSHQLYECALDPSPGAIIRVRYPQTLSWALRMLDPVLEGDWAAWSAIAPTLTPLLENIGAYFLPWSQANAEALAAERDEFSVELAGQTYRQQPQKYHAKSLKAIRAKYAPLAEDKNLAAILEQAGCRQYLI